MTLLQVGRCVDRLVVNASTCFVDIGLHVGALAEDPCAFNLEGFLFHSWFSSRVRLAKNEYLNYN
jgi:hypothetical protein